MTAMAVAQIPIRAATAEERVAGGTGARTLGGVQMLSLSSNVKV